MSTGLAATGWFTGETGVPQFAVWQLPDGGARAVAVLVGTIGHETHVVHRGLRVLADSLVAQGIATLQVDHPGLGDSGEAPVGADEVALWVSGVRSAVEQARASGAERVVLVGVRVGALLVTAADVPDVDAVVLWDPWATGSAYLRHLRGLMLLAGLPPTSTPEGAVPAVEGPGTWLAGETAATLRALPLRPTTTRTLAVLREAAPRGREIEALTASPDVEVLATTEQEAFLDVIDLEYRTPVATIDDIARWIAESVPSRRSPVAPSLDSSVVLDLRDGRRVREHVRTLGSRHLFAIVSEPEHGEPGSTVLVAGAGTTHHPGPNRMWVALTRDLAARGRRAVRFDYADMGNSPGGSGPEGPLYYTSDRIADVRDAVAGLGTDPSRLALVGLCSGSWATAMAARELGPAALCLVNPLIWTTSPPALGPSVSAAARAASDAPVSRKKRILAKPWARASADAAWKVLVALRLRPTPEDLLTGISARGTRVTTTMGPSEHHLYALRQRPGGLRRLQSDPRLRLDRTDLPDHGLLAQASREHVLDSVPRWLDADLP